MGVMHDNYAASEVLSRSVATSLEGKVLNHTFTCRNVQDTLTVTSEAQSSDDGDLESDHSIDSESAAQQGGEPSTSQDEGREVSSDLAAQQGGEPSTSQDEGREFTSEPAAQQGGELSISQNEGREVTSQPAAQYAQGGEASNSTPNRDENESMAMNCLKSLESAEFEVGYYRVYVLRSLSHA